MKTSSSIIVETACPSCDLSGDICRASLSGLPLDVERQRKYCLTEKFSDCPIFLSRLLSLRH
jgi:hypothetical protein